MRFGILIFFGVLYSLALIVKHDGNLNIRIITFSLVNQYDKLTSWTGVDDKLFDITNSSTILIMAAILLIPLFFIFQMFLFLMAVCCLLFVDLPLCLILHVVYEWTGYIPPIFLHPKEMINYKNFHRVGEDLASGPPGFCHD